MRKKRKQTTVKLSISPNNPPPKRSTVNLFKIPQFDAALAVFILSIFLGVGLQMIFPSNLRLGYFIILACIAITMPLLVWAYVQYLKKKAKKMMWIACFISFVFIITGIPVIILSPPTITSPGSISGPGTTINNLTPTLQWNSVYNADYYAIAISVYPYGSSNVFYNPQNVTGTSLAIPSGILANGQRYCWNMQSHNIAGWSSNISNALYFQTPADTSIANPNSVFHDAAHVYIVPTLPKVRRGDRVTMSVVLFPGDHEVSYLKIPLRWQPDALEDFQIVNIDTGIGLTSDILDSNVDKGHAEIGIGFGLYGPFRPNRDSRVVLSFSLRAVGKQGSEVEIKFGPEVQALSLSQWDKVDQNVLGYKDGADGAIVHIQ